MAGLCGKADRSKAAHPVQRFEELGLSGTPDSKGFKHMEQKMNYKTSFVKLAAGLCCAALAGWLIAACSQTAAPGQSIVQRVEGEQPAPPPATGFLGSDYSLLQPPSSGSVPGQKAMLAYINPNANFSQYNQVFIAPVTYWADANSKLTAAQQQSLCNYMYTVLQSDFAKNFAIASEPGPNVASLTAALTDATAATPALRAVSVVEPHLRALDMIKKELTGTYAFVGSATGEAKLTDSVSGQLLAAWADQRFGGLSAKNVDVWEWGDADNVMNYWANALDQRLASLGIQQTGGVAGASS
jgi:Protein of unknown function (DUF3313)